MAKFREVRHLEIDRLVASSQQARTREVDKDLDELVNNIRVHGQLEPVIVAPLENDGQTSYEIIAGQRRWLAMKQLGAKLISAAILDQRVDEATAHVLSISENLVRRDLHSKDLIDACTRLYQKYGSIKYVAEELGLPYNKVRTCVKFDRLRPELKRLVRDGGMDVKTALRMEDHLDGANVVEEANLRRMAKELAGMTSAQQIDYLKHMGTSRPDSIPVQANASNGHRPGDVTQIIVTLKKEDAAALRAWAKSQNLTQDQGAARILAAYLRNRERVNGSLVKAPRQG